MLPRELPSHLRPYVVEQDYSQYTPINQAVWRFSLRQLREYLSVYGHDSYLTGLAETGISLEEIPRVSEMSRCLERYGWRAVGVSGFIPPAAFMELQAMGILPIGTVMRTLEHILYTPAPDIVHESAGHAPILIHPEFSSYLHKYAHAARKAIFHKEDLELYEAIRNLSDIKEHPNSSEEEITTAQSHLDVAVKNLGEPSEANLLSRLNWWTAEYGLIGVAGQARIYGAGLLSSLGESQTCYHQNVTKLPMSLKCIEYTYDITEKQPQLFVTPDFQKLIDVVSELADTMAFRLGGLVGLERIHRARTVNTVEYNSGLQISGVLADYLQNDQGPTYLRFTGPGQLSYQEEELPGHSTQRHPDGFGAPVGLLRGMHKCLSRLTPKELYQMGIVEGHDVTLEFASGVVVAGRLTTILRREARTILMTFAQCRVTRGSDVLFDPAWGEYDMAVGSTLPSIFGGAADREKYQSEFFAVKRVPPVQRTAAEQQLNGLYAKVRDLREHGSESEDVVAALQTVVETLDREFPEDWLCRLEIFELTAAMDAPPPWQETVHRFLATRAAQGDELGQAIGLGLRLAQGGSDA
jgi:phenylalanine-4-hydroxylase